MFAGPGISFLLNEAGPMNPVLSPVVDKHEAFKKYLLGLKEELKSYFDSRPTRPY